MLFVLVLILIGKFFSLVNWFLTSDLSECEFYNRYLKKLRVPFCKNVLANSCEIDSLADPIRRALDADAEGGGWT